jgi:hypothetical protein
LADQWFGEWQPAFAPWSFDEFESFSLAMADTPPAPAGACTPQRVVVVK